MILLGFLPNILLLNHILTPTFESNLAEEAFSVLEGPRLHLTRWSCTSCFLQRGAPLQGPVYRLMLTLKMCSGPKTEKRN